ncbi:hypothetical protein OH77DRAFT_1396572, partial [Trametes cingulata]
DPWEIVECRAIEPVSTYNEDEVEGAVSGWLSLGRKLICRVTVTGMQIMRVHSTVMHRTYCFDLKSTSDLRRAVLFARQKLLQEAAEKDFNIFLIEGWSVTHLRKGKRHRAEVRYSAKPAYAMTKESGPHTPPFLAMLDVRDGL